ncbi:eCIS core domain-containing protein [Hymenobacter ruricola]|uniref:DUF4157 domain-containing protein n=1 Tax=Hymenobacter ruricola TaxID=2791023 RepID=A0ABS0I707_9BACT|nr:DUF4157 domain-containing protein [Hymenobacter ruricola]MBF9222679.1 DUF4157 domain-containing protein [Hymenobacter ruricola]
MKASLPARATRAAVPALHAHAQAQADQRPSAVAQRQALAALDGSPRQVAQRRALGTLAASPRQTAQRQARVANLPARNTTGLPNQLKAGVESLSGHSFDDVRVHYNSSKPATLQALAYAQGTDIHIGPGQEQHLPHEAWHVAQQKQGRVRATTQLRSGMPVNDTQPLEQEADLMGRRAAKGETSPGPAPALTTGQAPAQAVMQPLWVYLDNLSGTRLNLRATSDPTVYELSSDGSKYKVISTAGGNTIVQKMPAPTASAPYEDWMYDGFSEYQDWTKQSTRVSMPGPWGGGNINATHKRGAPKISSRQQDFGKAKMGDTYTEYVRGATSGGHTDQEVANDLLSLDDTVLSSHLEQRAASMLHVTVYLAEEWRKQGAAKIYRAFLRKVIAGQATMADLITEFKFVASAQEGRKQVARFSDVHNGHRDQTDLSASEQLLYGHMSPTRDEDYDTDEDMEEDKKLAGTRDFSADNRGVKGWKNPWL